MSMISIQEIQNSLLNGKKDYVELMNKLISNIALNEPMIHAFINKKMNGEEVSRSIWRG